MEAMEKPMRGRYVRAILWPLIETGTTCQCLPRLSS